MLQRTVWIAPAVLLLLVACMPLPFGNNTGDGTNSTDTTTDSTDNTPSDATDTSSDDDNATTGPGLSGRLIATGPAKKAATFQSARETYTVVAQSEQTGTLYTTDTDGDGDFDLSLPDSESGNSFTVTVLGPDGKAVGPVLFGSSGTTGYTGLAPAGTTSLGDVTLPEDPLNSAIVPGSTADIDELVDNNVVARLDGSGVPVGLQSFGKGNDARAQGSSSQNSDADRDGLIDVFDADDDGDGTVDDFEGDGDPGGIPSDIHANFFMNLKISAGRASTYYNGTASEIETRLATDTIITFEVMDESADHGALTSAKLLETPGPAYLTNADKQIDSSGGLSYTNWKALDYAFDDLGGRLGVWVRPNAEMEAGDTFTLQVTFADGTLKRVTRMINYVFKNIPRLVQYGPAGGTLTDFDVDDATINGTESKPIPFDGTQDLTLVFAPPVDETGAYITGLDYSFQIFYQQASDRQQMNESIDWDETVPSAPTGFDRGTYWVYATDLTLSVDNTYTMTLPKALFPDTVTLTSGEDASIGGYKIDVTAECPSGNAAIMLEFTKQ